MFEFIVNIFKTQPSTNPQAPVDLNYRHLDQKATVTTKIAPNQPGRVYYHATYWFAICEQDVILEKDTPVFVKQRKANLLIVEPFACEIIRKTND